MISDLRYGFFCSIDSELRASTPLVDCHERCDRALDCVKLNCLLFLCPIASVSVIEMI